MTSPVGYGGSAGSDITASFLLPPLRRRCSYESGACRLAHRTSCRITENTAVAEVIRFSCERLEAYSDTLPSRRRVTKLAHLINVSTRSATSVVRASCIARRRRSNLGRTWVERIGQRLGPPGFERVCFISITKRGRQPPPSIVGRSNHGCARLGLDMRCCPTAHLAR